MDKLIKNRGLPGAVIYLGLPLYGIMLAVFIIIYITALNFKLNYNIIQGLNITEAWIFHLINWLFQTGIPLLFITAIIYVAYHKARNNLYSFLTDGRNYPRDHREFKRSYTDLVYFYSNAITNKIDTGRYPGTPWYETEGIIFGSCDGHTISIPSGANGRNITIIGRPDIGKTSCIIINTALRFGNNEPLSQSRNKNTSGSVFLIDLKGDIYEQTKYFRKIRVFNLRDPVHSQHFDPFTGFDKLSFDDIVKQVEDMSFIIIPEVPNSRDEYFTPGARDFFCGITLYALYLDRNVSFPDVCRLILGSNDERMAQLVGTCECPEARIYLEAKISESPVNRAGCYAKLTQAVRKFYNAKINKLFDKNTQESNLFNVQALEDGYDLYITIEQADLLIYSAAISMIVTQILTQLTLRNSNPNAGRLENGTLRPIAIILDEFAQLRNLSLSLFQSALMTLRSRNVSIIIAIQSRSSINDMFSSDYAAKTIEDTMYAYCCMAIQEPESREWFSKLVGEMKVLKASNSENMSADSNSTAQSASECYEPIIRPYTLGHLRSKAIVYIDGEYSFIDKTPYYKYKALNDFLEKKKIQNQRKSPKNAHRITETQRNQEEQNYDNRTKLNRRNN